MLQGENRKLNISKSVAFGTSRPAPGPETEPYTQPSLALSLSKLHTRSFGLIHHSLLPRCLTSSSQTVLGLVVPSVSRQLSPQILMQNDFRSEQTLQVLVYDLSITNHDTLHVKFCLGALLCVVDETNTTGVISMHSLHPQSLGWPSVLQRDVTFELWSTGSEYRYSLRSERYENLALMSVLISICLHRFAFPNVSSVLKGALAEENSPSLILRLPVVLLILSRPQSPSPESPA